MRVTDDDARALSRAIGLGDTEAFARLYRAWYAPLLMLIRRSCGRDDAFAHDVLHDAMLDVIRAMPELPHAGALDAWLRRAVLHRALDHLRRERRRFDRERGRDLPGGDPRADGIERQEAVQRMLDGIGQESRGLLMLRFGHGRALDRIARSIGLSGSAVDGRIRRAVAALRSGTPTEGHPDA